MKFLKQKIAEKYGSCNWEHLLTYASYGKRVKAIDEYAKQYGKIKVKEFSSKQDVSGSLPDGDFTVRGTITYDMKKGTSKYKAKRQ